MTSAKKSGECSICCFDRALSVLGTRPSRCTVRHLSADMRSTGTEQPPPVLSADEADRLWREVCMFGGMEAWMLYVCLYCRRSRPCSLSLDALQVGDCGAVAGQASAARLCGCVPGGYAQAVFDSVNASTRLNPHWVRLVCSRVRRVTATAFEAAYLTPLNDPAFASAVQDALDSFFKKGVVAVGRCEWRVCVLLRACEAQPRHGCVPEVRLRGAPADWFCVDMCVSLCPSLRRRASRRSDFTLRLR